MSAPSVAEVVAFARGEAAWFRRNRGDVGEQDQYIMTAKSEMHDAIADALERLAQIEAAWDELKAALRLRMQNRLREARGAADQIGEAHAYDQAVAIMDALDPRAKVAAD